MVSGEEKFPIVVTFEFTTWCAVCDVRDFATPLCRDKCAASEGEKSERNLHLVDGGGKDDRGMEKARLQFEREMANRWILI